MLLDDLDTFLRQTLDIEEAMNGDPSLNGLQVDRENREVDCVVCAVDASMETFERAAEREADMIFVHHGLFWGRDLALTRSHFRRVKFLLDHDIALYAVHLPLDVHASLGNNAGMAHRLELLDTSPFGEYRGVCIGYQGRLPEPLTIDQVIARLGFDRRECNSVLPFGKERISTVGIVSGGGTHEIDQAVAADLDLYVTGDASHEMYHYCLEESINLLCAGHYQTETFGVRSVSELLFRELGLTTAFIDVPTGL